MDKRGLRRTIIERRDKLTALEVDEKSALIAERLYRLPAYRDARTVMFFISFGSEVNTRLMVEETIRQGKIVLAPKALPEKREMIPSLVIDWDADLAPGAYGIPEPRDERMRPHDPKTIDLLLVPGVAFDGKGNRLGYGGGYYDRFFELLRNDTPLVALVFDFQIQPAVPMEEWDRRVDCIITDKQLIFPEIS